MFIAFSFCKEKRIQYVTPEMILSVLAGKSDAFRKALKASGADFRTLRAGLEKFVNSADIVPEDIPIDTDFSEQSKKLIGAAMRMAINSGAEEAGLMEYAKAIFRIEESPAASLLFKVIGGDINKFLDQVAIYTGTAGTARAGHGGGGADDADTDIYPKEAYTLHLGDGDDEPDVKPGNAAPDWHSLVTCINDHTADRNPLIGREKELDETIRVLCRKEKNNPLHVGEPGVGKTSIVYGLADRINHGKVPARLADCRIYAMDMGSMIAGAQFRGDFEKKIKTVMEGAKEEGNVIIYIDEIHNIIGAGRGGDGALDASNMLKPYLETGDIRFIGSTTYDEYKRYLAKSKGIVRRFQEIDIAEPTVEETAEILRGLKPSFQSYHHVVYKADALEYAAGASAKYIKGRFLPDKAIDLIDEAGAYLEVHPKDRAVQYVDKALIKQILIKMCKIESRALAGNDDTSLSSLGERISARIFGQDEAVRQVTEAVEMSRTGLQDDDKPLASLLFVGPTGVGKTEVARVLASELGVSLVRFDMSEYTEKHTVAKLIGSPAGYVGYEDGGLLTDAIRKSPNCVLLLDEIEKAHPDIYNILLQVMDYAVLTDNRGQKADFRNVIIIMTSNAGAQFASKANIGFTAHVSRGEAMLGQVKKLFKPEFLNRLIGSSIPGYGHGYGRKNPRQETLGDRRKTQKTQCEH